MKPRYFEKGIPLSWLVTINIKPLKDLVRDELPPHNILRKVIPAEPDQIPRYALLRKLETWLALRRAVREALRERH